MATESVFQTPKLLALNSLLKQKNEELVRRITVMKDELHRLNIEYELLQRIHDERTS